MNPDLTVLAADCDALSRMPAWAIVAVILGGLATFAFIVWCMER